MLEIASFPQSDKHVEKRCVASARLRRVRRVAAKHGLAIVSSFGALTVVTTTTDRPRSVHGLVGVPLDEIEAALPIPKAAPKRELSDAEVDRLIGRVGPERLLSRLDALTRPPQLAAAE
jgi:hypothetical protein